jgi:hypothetical protein
MESTNFKEISKLFSASYLLSLMEGNNSQRFHDLSKLIDTCHSMTIKDVLQNIYILLRNHYRNEYVYKNILISNIKEYETNTHYALFSEMDIGASSRIDIAHFSSSNHAYEIKTELDSFSRLDKQLNDYKKGFEYIWTIVPEQKLNKLLLTIDNSIGIKVLDHNNNLTVYRKAQSNLEEITHGGLFSLLRQKEFLLLMKIYYGHDFNNQSYAARIKLQNMFQDIDIQQAHNISIGIIRNRVQQTKINLLMGDTPSGLLPIYLNQTVQKKAKQFLHFLNSSIDEFDNHIHMMQHRKLF